MRVQQNIFIKRTSVLAIVVIALGAVFYSPHVIRADQIETQNSIDSENLELSKIDVPFIRNEGQINDTDVSFYVETFAGNVYIMPHGLRYAFNSNKDGDRSVVAVDESFAGGKNLQAVGKTPTTTSVNYFIGKDKSQWKSSIDTFGMVDGGEVWDGVAVSFASRGNNIEKIYTVAPGADAGQIGMSISGATLALSEDGSLFVQTPKGDVVMTAPIAYQDINGVRHDVDVKYYLLNKTTYGFSLGHYNKNYPLVIDPLIASTLLGGSALDSVKGMAVTATSVYIAGNTESNDLPTTVGAFDTSYNDSGDGFIAKLSLDLTDLEAITYIGGADSDQIADLVITGSNVWVAGTTSGTDFPTTAGVYQEDINGASNDSFLTKLSLDLASLQASTYFGGSNNENTHVLAVDGSAAYIGGLTFSNDLPVTAGAIDENYTSADGFVSKFSLNLTSLTASTYIGTGVFIGDMLLSGSSVMITGFADTFPTTMGAYDTTANGDNDAFVSVLANNLASLTASTLLGDADSDEGRGLAFDGSDIYVTGTTTSTDFPTTMGAYQTMAAGNEEAFVSIFPLNLTSLTASTFLGGTGSDQGLSIALTDDGVYVGGITDGADFPVTAGAYDESYNDNGDAVVARLSLDLSDLTAATYFGGDDEDEVVALVATEDEIYVTGLTTSSDFPVTAGAYDETPNGSSDLYVSALSFDLSLSSNTAPAATAPTASQTNQTDVTFNTQITDADADAVSFTVEYSRDNIAWSAATLASVSASSGTPAIAGNSITGVTTAVPNTVTVVWNAGANLTNTIDNTVFIRVLANDGTVDGALATSAAFSLDTTPPPSSGSAAGGGGGGGGSSARHPSGTLVLDGTTVYLIEDGKRLPFRNPEEYFSYGYNFGQIVPISAADKILPLGETGIVKALPGTIAIDDTDGRTVYMIGLDGTKQGFASAAVFEALGYRFDDLPTIDLSDYITTQVIQLAGAPHPEGSLVLDGMTVWWILGGSRTGFTSEQVFRTYGFSFDRVVKANTADLALPEGPLLKFRDGTLVVENGIYYIISDGKKFSFQSVSDLVGRGYSLSNVISADLSSYESGGRVQ